MVNAFPPGVSWRTLGARSLGLWLPLCPPPTPAPAQAGGAQHRAVPSSSKEHEGKRVTGRHPGWATGLSRVFIAASETERLESPRGTSTFPRPRREKGGRPKAMVRALTISPRPTPVARGGFGGLLVVIDQIVQPS